MEEASQAYDMTQRTVKNRSPFNPRGFYTQVKSRAPKMPFYKQRCNSELKVFLKERDLVAKEQHLESIEALVEGEYRVRPTAS